MTHDEKIFYALKEFKQFLIENNAYSDFLYEIYKHKELNGYEEFMCFLKTLYLLTYTDSIINRGFVWYDTKNPSIWSKLHNDWVSNRTYAVL